MLTGLDILLDRMKTNPEEFLKDGNVPHDGEIFGGKWSDLLDYAWRVGSDEERKALQDAKIAFYRDDFNERVMKRLAGEEKVEETLALKVRATYPHPHTAAQKQNPAQASSHWTDPRITMQDVMLQGNGYGQQAQIKQEGEPVGGVGNGFWGGVVASGKGKLW